MVPGSWQGTRYREMGNRPELKEPHAAPLLVSIAASTASISCRPLDWVDLSGLELVTLRKAVTLITIMSVSHNKEIIWEESTTNMYCSNVSPC